MTKTKRLECRFYIFIGFAHNTRGGNYGEEKEEKHGAAQSFESSGRRAEKIAQRSERIHPAHEQS